MEQIQLIYVVIIFLIVFGIMFAIILTMLEPDIGKKAASVIAAAVNPISSIIGGALGKIFETIIWF
jgi:hypothetical protein